MFLAPIGLFFGRMLASKLAMILVVAGLITGAVVYAEVMKLRAYNRGVADTVAKTEKIIQKKEVDKRHDKDRVNILPDPELDCELKRMRNPAAPCR